VTTQYHTKLESKRPTIGGPELDPAVIELFAEMQGAIVVPVVMRVGRWVADTWPLDPTGRLVPPWNRELYVMARMAYSGDYDARVALLDEIGASGLRGGRALHLVRLDETLAPTFNPKRPDSRSTWERFPPAGARQELHKLLREALRDKRRDRPRLVDIDPEEALPRNQSSDPRRKLDPVLAEYILMDAVFRSLPERNALVVWLHVELFDRDHPSRTTRHVAEALGVPIETVRGHRKEAAKNPQFREILGL
jgi:hypothetical protein